MTKNTIIAIDLPDHEFLYLAKEAYEREITTNQHIINVVSAAASKVLLEEVELLREQNKELEGLTKLAKQDEKDAESDPDTPPGPDNAKLWNLIGKAIGAFQQMWYHNLGARPTGNNRSLRRRRRP